MAKILHIQSSPRGDRSASIAVAEQFIASYRASHPGDTVETLDLWHAKLPEVDGALLDARYAIATGGSPNAVQCEAWKAVIEIVSHFIAADKFLLSAPMWNFSIPYKLKHYIDLIAQPGLTFRYTPGEGYQGLVIGKPLVAVFARGGAYGPGTGAESYDQQSGYLKQVFGFIGFTEIHEVLIEPTLASPTSKGEAVASASATATELAKRF